MNINEFADFIRQIDIENVTIEEIFEYDDDPTHLMVFEIKTPFNLTLETIHGFICFDCDGIQLDVDHGIAYFFQNGVDYFMQNLRNIHRVVRISEK